MSDSVVIPLEILSRRIALVRASVFAHLSDDELAHVALDMIPSALRGTAGKDAPRIYQLAHSAEVRHRQARTSPPAVLLYMDYSL